MPHYDVIVVGGGPGGYVAALRAGMLRLKVALVERDALGGTCLNVGCIPTKAMLHAAEVFSAGRSLAAFGLPEPPAGPPGGEFSAKATAWRRGVVETLRKGVAALLKARGVEVIRGSAVISAEREVSVAGSDGKTLVLTASHVILATGSESVVPAALGPVGGRVMTSTEALELQEVPASAAVIGGGYIGCEFASCWADLGVKVVVIEMLPDILQGAEPEIRKELERSLKRRKARILTGVKVASLKASGDSVTVELEGAEPVKAERVLIAVGRRPRTKELGLERLGVRMEGPFVAVDERCRSSAPWLLAVGDVTPGPMLAHKASRQGVVAAESAAGREGAPFRGPVPSCIFTRPEVASVGLTEAAAWESGHEVVTGVFQMRALGRAHAAGETSGLVKVVAEKGTERVLGVSMACERATDLIAEAALAIRLEATLEELATTVHAHPTFAEALMEAAEAARGEGIHSL